MKGLHYSGLRAMAKPVLGGLGSILMLHRVNDLKTGAFSPNSHLSVTPEFLDRLILSLKRSGYDFISMDEAVERVQNPLAQEGKKPFLTMTLDDGYRDNLENAIPVFRRHRVPYLIYIAPGFLEGTSILWWEALEKIFANQKQIYIDMPDGREDLDISTSEKKSRNYQSFVHDMLFNVPEDVQRNITNQLCKAYRFDAVKYTQSEIMNWQQLKTLSDDPLCMLGAHTLGHYALAKLNEKQMQYEVVQSRAVMESELGKKPEHFAYPYGHSRLAKKRDFDFVCKQDFKSAVTTRHGVLYEGHAKHACSLPRVSLNGHYSSVAEVKSMLSGISTLLVNKGRKLNVA